MQNKVVENRINLGNRIVKVTEYRMQFTYFSVLKPQL